MANLPYTSQSSPQGSISFAGGLNSTGGPLSLEDNESSDLQNIDFDVFGSILKRNGYAHITTAGTTGSADGIYSYEYSSGGTVTRYTMKVAGTTLNKMDNFDGIWDDISGAVIITDGTHCDFETFLNTMYATNGVDAPFQWAGVGTATVMSVPSGLTSAKCVKLFNNYLFLGNVVVGGINYPSRIYWSGLKDTTNWNGADWIDVAKDDGQQIVALRVLGDRLVVYKDRSIYNVFYTGEADVPFILPYGGKSNSNVGCIAQFSLADVENCHVFLAPDGLYLYDGLNSTKLSYKIKNTLYGGGTWTGWNTTRFYQARAATYRVKNKYLLALPGYGATNNNKVVVWDYFNNAFSIYSGMSVSSMYTFFVSGTDERVYFSDYNGYDYRMDYGTDDYPLTVKTAINAYYYTNWRAFGDLISQKGIPEVVIYFLMNTGTLVFSYSYDFEDSDQYSSTFTMSAGTDYWDAFNWGVGVWARSGGGMIRRDLNGRGRTVRFKLSNAATGETFRIDGLGTFPHLETNV